MNADKVAELLELIAGRGPEVDGDSHGRRMGGVLSAVLDQKLSALADEATQIATAIVGIEGRLKETARQTVRELLLNKSTDLTVLQLLRDFGKISAKRAVSDSDRGAYTAVYFAAIASGLVFHGRRITSFSESKLIASLGKLSNNREVPEDLLQLFQNAIVKCEEHRSAKDQG